MTARYTVEPVRVELERRVDVLRDGQRVGYVVERVVHSAARNSEYAEVYGSWTGGKSHRSDAEAVYSADEEGTIGDAIAAVIARDETDRGWAVQQRLDRCVSRVAAELAPHCDALVALERARNLVQALQCADEGDRLACAKAVLLTRADEIRGIDTATARAVAAFASVWDAP